MFKKKIFFFKGILQKKKNSLFLKGKKGKRGKRGRRGIQRIQRIQGIQGIQGIIKKKTSFFFEKEKEEYKRYEVFFFCPLPLKKRLFSAIKKRRIE